MWNQGKNVFDSERYARDSISKPTVVIIKYSYFREKSGNIRLVI